MSKKQSNQRAEQLRKGEFFRHLDTTLDISKSARKAGIYRPVKMTLDAFNAYARVPEQYPWITTATNIQDLLKAFKAAKRENPKSVAFEFTYWAWTNTGASAERKVVAIFESKRRFLFKWITIAEPSDCLTVGSEF